MGGKPGRTNGTIGMNHGSCHTQKKKKTNRRIFSIIGDRHHHTSFNDIVTTKAIPRPSRPQTSNKKLAREQNHEVITEINATFLPPRRPPIVDDDDNDDRGLFTLYDEDDE
jgi:hypothetical protein